MALSVCHTSPMFNVGDVVRKLRQERGWGVVELSERAGVDKGTISALERGKDFRAQTLEAIASALGMTVPKIYEYIAAIEGIKRAAEAIADHYESSESVELLEDDVSVYVREDIPVIQEGDASPQGLIWDAETKATREIEEFTSRPYNYRERGAYAVVLRGDSMEPLLKRGMRLIVSPNVKPTSGDLVYAQLKSGERLAKIASRQPAGWLLSSANAAYGPRVVSDDEIEHIHKVAYVRFLK